MELHALILSSTLMAEAADKMPTRSGSTRIGNSHIHCVRTHTNAGT